MSMRGAFTLFESEENDLIAELAPLARFDRARRVRALMRAGLVYERHRSTGAENLPAAPSTAPVVASTTTRRAPQAISSEATAKATAGVSRARKARCPTQSEPAVASSVRGRRKP